MERSIRLPINAFDVQRRITKYLDEFKEKNGRFPTLEECAEASKVTMPTFRAYIEHKEKPVSLDQMISSGGNSQILERSLIDLITCSDRSPEEYLEIQSCLDHLDELLALLPDRDRQMLELRYGLKNGGKGMTYAVIGEIMKISRERVRQIERISLKKIRFKLHGKVFP